MAPSARFDVTIIGNISGVSPTPTANAKSTALIHSPFAKPFKRSTSGIMTREKRTSNQLTLLTPKSKLVLARYPASDRAIQPK